MFSRIQPLFVLPLGFLLAACGGESASPPGVRFVDVAREAGLELRHYNGARGQYYYVETFGAGAAFIDYDGDGWQDLYLVNGAPLSDPPPQSPPRNLLYRNEGGRFADLTEKAGAGDTGYGMGVAAADYDNDGDQDLFVANYGANLLYRNEGGRFADLTEKAGVGDARWGSSCGFLDYDNDGDLDLFVANYVDFRLEENVVCRQGSLRSYCRPEVYEPTGDLLYRNEGGRFAEVSATAGITLKGRGLGVAFSDFDLDGDTDLYVANDGTMNFLYRNEGGRFAEVGLQTGTRYNEYGRAEAGMGTDFGDFDNDGDPDLFVTNFAYETNTLYRNDGEHFAEVSARLGLAEVSYLPLGFGTRFLDFDNDGDLDLFAANGHIMDHIARYDSTQTYAQRNQMLRNEGGRFAEVSAALGPAFARVNVGRAAAAADFDNDGDLDLLVSCNAGRPRLLRNEGGNRRHWLSLQLVGAGQLDALGARVVLEAGGRRQMRERQSGGSYLSSHDPRLHFGLGEATRARIEIHWPDGAVQRLEDVPADQILRLVQPHPRTASPD